MRPSSSVSPSYAITPVKELSPDKNKLKLRIKEFRADGESTQLGVVSARKLFAYIKYVVSQFAQLEAHEEDRVSGEKESEMVMPLEYHPPKLRSAPSRRESMMCSPPTRPLSASRPLSAQFGRTPGGTSYLKGAPADARIYGEPFEMRDMRRLQQPFSTRNAPMLISRLYAILVNFDPLRCVVLPDRLVVLVPDGAEKVVADLGARLERSFAMLGQMDAEADDDDEVYNKHSAATKASFPFRAIESIVRTVLSTLEDELAKIAVEVKECVRWLTARVNNVGISELEALRKLKNRVATQDARAAMTRQAFEDILNDDEDMALMAFVAQPEEKPEPLSEDPDPAAAAASAGGSEAEAPAAAPSTALEAAIAATVADPAVMDTAAATDAAAAAIASPSADAPQSLAPALSPIVEHQASTITAAEADLAALTALSSAASAAVATRTTPQVLSGGGKRSSLTNVLGAFGRRSSSDAADNCGDFQAGDAGAEFGPADGSAASSSSEQQRQQQQKQQAPLQPLPPIPRPFSASREAAAPIDPENCRPAVVLTEDHEVFEVLFEFHLQTVSTVQTSLDLLRSELVNGEQFHLTRLSMGRNKLLTVTLLFNVVSMCTAVGSFLGSVFGMNLTSGLEGREGLWAQVTFGSATLIVGGTVAIFTYMRWAGVLSQEMA